MKILDNSIGETRVIADGTDLIPRMRSGMATPKRLLDIRKLSLSSIKLQDDFICIGASATHTAIIESELLSVYCPILRKVAYEIAGLPVRNRGTVGGNLVNASPAADQTMRNASRTLNEAGTQVVLFSDIKELRSKL